MSKFKYGVGMAVCDRGANQPIMDASAVIELAYPKPNPKQHPVIDPSIFKAHKWAGLEAYNPEKHIGPTSRYSHKPWPFK